MNATLQSALSALIEHLNASSISYAILGDTRDFPHVRSDIDLCVDNYQEFLRCLQSFCAANQYKLIRADHHATGIRFDVLLDMRSSIPVILEGPDVLFFPTYKIKGNVGLSYKSLLRSRVKSKNRFYIPCPSDAFIFYLIKRLDKGGLSSEQLNYLSYSWSQDPDAATAKLHYFFSASYVAVLKTAIANNDLAVITALIPTLRNALRRRAKPDLRRQWWAIRRIITRTLHPSGIMVALLGADGSGKSSAIANATKALAPTFSHVRYIHLYPKIIPRQGDTTSVTNPHGKKPRGFFGSVTKLAYFILAYTFGYFFCVWPALIKRELVIFDRYFHDLLVDTRRYRYGAPLMFARLARHLIPTPDLFILLDAPPEILQSRKKEVSFAESARQRNAYLELFEVFPNKVVIDASVSLDKSFTGVNVAILDVLAGRTARVLTRNLWQPQII